MVKENYEPHRKRYLQAMFGKDFSETEKADKDRIKAALDCAHEIRQFEISLYWKRSLFFWGFILTLFGILGLMLTAKKPTLLTDFMPVIIAALGFFTTCAWYYVEKGSKAWMANWELHIDYLEDGITGKLYKTRLWLDGKKDNFFSASKITQTVIFAFGIFWFLTSVFVTLNALLTKKQERMLYSTFDPHFQCIIKFFENSPWISLVVSILLPSLIWLFVCILTCCKKSCILACWKKFLACCRKFFTCCKKCSFSDCCKKFLTCMKKCGLGYWRTGDNEEFTETVRFSQRARKLKKAKKAKKVTCL